MVGRKPRLLPGVFNHDALRRHGGGLRRSPFLSGEEVLHPFPFAEMDRLHGETGFEREERWGDFRGSAFDPSLVPGRTVTLYRSAGKGFKAP